MNKLREYRKRKCLSQAQVAEIVCLDQATVSAHEIGTRSIRVEQLAKYARLYGCSLDDLYSEQSPSTEQTAT